MLLFLCPKGPETSLVLLQFFFIFPLVWWSFKLQLRADILFRAAILWAMR